MEGWLFRIFFYDLDNHFDGIVIVHVYLTTFATNTNQKVFFGINYLRFFFKFVMRVFFFRILIEWGFYISIIEI